MKFTKTGKYSKSWSSSAGYNLTLEHVRELNNLYMWRIFVLPKQSGVKKFFPALLNRKNIYIENFFHFLGGNEISAKKM